MPVSFPALIEMTDLNSAYGFSIFGISKLGWSLSGLGDFNGDGIDDIAVADPSGAGIAYVIYGGSDLGESGSIDLSYFLVDGSSGFRLEGDAYHSVYSEDRLVYSTTPLIVKDAKQSEAINRRFAKLDDSSELLFKQEVIPSLADALVNQNGYSVENHAREALEVKELLVSEIVDSASLLRQYFEKDAEGNKPTAKQVAMAIRRILPANVGLWKYSEDNFASLLMQYEKEIREELNEIIGRAHHGYGQLIETIKETQTASAQSIAALREGCFAFFSATCCRNQGGEEITAQLVSRRASSELSEVEIEISAFGARRASALEDQQAIDIEAKESVTGPVVS